MFALINARIIDGNGHKPIENATLLIDGTRIKEFGAGITVPGGISVIDLKGKTLLPAFSDAHTHLGGTDLLTRPGLGSRDTTYDYALNSVNLLRWGVTTVRTAGDFMPDIVSFKGDVASKQLCAPRVLTAGRMFVAQGGHPLDTVYFGDESIRDNACVVCSENTDIDAEVKTLAAAGVDWIKAFISTMNKMDYPNSVPRLSNGTLKKIADAAHRYGKPVMVHVEGPSDIEEAMDIGVESIEHTIGTGAANFDISDSLLTKLADSKTFVVPTMSAIKSHDGSLKGAELVYPHLEKAVKKMIDAGVRVGVGCDSGIPFLPYGESVHTEMELLVGAGMSPMGAICAATKGNAELFRAHADLGSVEAGKLADLVVVGADPLKNICNTRQVELVIKEGRVVFDRMLAN